MAKQKKLRAPVTKGAARVPVIIQREALECGATSLGMVLAYFGKWVTPEQLRLDCGVGRDGSSAKNIIKAARNYGLEARAFRTEPEELKKRGVFPCILHWNFVHFVVLCGFRGGKAVINDPDRGRIAVDWEEFDRSFTGVCLTFRPGENFVPDGKRRSVVKFAKQRLHRMGGAFAFIALTSLIASVVGILTPAFTSMFADYLLTGEYDDLLLPFIIALSAVFAVQFITALIQKWRLCTLESKLSSVANASFMWHVLRLPVEFFSQRMAGDISARQSKNESIAYSLIQQLAPLLFNLIMLVVYLAIMINYSLILTLIGVASIVLNMFVSLLVSRKRVNITKVQVRGEGNLSGQTISGIEMIETIKSSGAENGFFEKWAGYQATVNTSSVKFSKLNSYLGSLPSIISTLADVAILITGIWLIIDGQFTSGALLAFQGFMTSFSTPVNDLIGVGQSVQEMRTDMDDIEDIMSYPTDVPDRIEDEIVEGESYNKLSGAIVMKDVTFGYSRLDPPLIEHFDLTLEPGKSVAFVGPSGCGKSTLSKLITGLYKPWSGEILYDGRRREDINRAVFTGSIAVVDQDIILFNDTIANNIKMWDTSIEDFEMIMAARDAQLHESIMLRDGGYNHVILDGGKDFSGGERQRMEIARVLAQDPTVIVMDEATSALDAKTEFDVTNAIKQRGVTTVVVAHRISAIRDCDEIVVLDGGKVVERGTHEQLMQQNGLYARLITSE